MSLLDEWAEAEGAAAAALAAAAPGWAPGAAPGAAPLFFPDADGGDDAADDAAGGAEVAAPLFAIETLEKDASHGQGAITAVAAAANVVLLGTAAGALIRYDFAEGAATGARRRAGGTPRGQ
jgi:hypothetical protein